MTSSPQHQRNDRTDGLPPRGALYASLAAEGLTGTEIARRCGVTLATVSNAARQFGFHFRDGRADNGPKLRAALLNTERLNLIRAEAAAGATATEVAEQLGVSRRRVHAIAAREGIHFRRHHEHIADFLAGAKKPRQQ